MLTRLRQAWTVLAPEQRRVAVAAVLVVVSLLLPWYSKNTNAVTRSGLVSGHEAKSALLVPSFVEASILLVAVAVLALMFARGERRAFHLPFGDGMVVTAAGAWVGFLVFFRFIDQPAGGHSPNLTYEYGLSWGIFFGLLAAAFLLYCGVRLRQAELPEPRARRRDPDAGPPPPPPPPPAAPPPPPTTTAATRVAAGRSRSRPPIDGGTQLSFDEQE